MICLGSLRFHWVSYSRHYNFTTGKSLRTTTGDLPIAIPMMLPTSLTYNTHSIHLNLGDRLLLIELPCAETPPASFNLLRTGSSPGELNDEATNDASTRLRMCEELTTSIAYHASRLQKRMTRQSSLEEINRTFCFSSCSYISTLWFPRKHGHARCEQSL